MTYKIISGRYESGTEEQQAGYRMLFGEDNIQYKFDLYFHWYNIVHELGHCMVATQNITMSNVQEEMFVNEFAVAYWNYIGANTQLKELEEILKGIIATIDSPVPEDSGFTEYYESIWGTEVLDDVMIYGYFQLNSVLEAMRGKKDLKTVLKSIDIDLDSSMSMSKSEGTICAQNVYKVLDTAVANINKLDINSIHVSVELVDNPMIQCAQQCE